MSKIIICNATPPEYQACLRAFGATEFIHILKTGMGLRAARQALQKEIQNNGKPDLVVSSGYAGTWTAGLELHDWVFAEKLYLWPEKQDDAVDLLDFSILNKIELVQKIKKQLVFLKNVESVTTEYVYSKPRQSKVVIQDFSVDMESYALGQVCMDAGIPFFVLRMISDTPTKPLPEFISAWTKTFVESTAKGKLSAGVESLKKTFSDLPEVKDFLVSGKKMQSQYEQGWITAREIFL